MNVSEYFTKDKDKNKNNTNKKEMSRHQYKNRKWTDDRASSRDWNKDRNLDSKDTWSRHSSRKTKDKKWTRDQNSSTSRTNNWNRNDRSRSSRNRSDRKDRDDKNGYNRSDRNDKNRYNRTDRKDRDDKNGYNRSDRNDKNGYNRSNRKDRDDRNRNKTDKHQSDKSSIPEKPLTKSDNGWKPVRQRVDESTIEGKIEINVKEAQGYLNKMTLATFDVLSDKFATVAALEKGSPPLPGILKLLTDRIFEQALLQPTFCHMYAALCHKIHQEMKNFRMVLLNKCQEEFERGSKEPPDNLDSSERTVFIYKAKKRMLGNIKFIGELFKNNVLVEPVMYECFKHLLKEQTPDNPDEERIEALCELMTNIGKLMDHDKGKSRIDKYFLEIEQIQTGGNVSNRVRFMIEDIKDLRSNEWKSIR
jgi:translation initiation factor 4G